MGARVIRIGMKVETDFCMKIRSSVVMSRLKIWSEGINQTIVLFFFLLKKQMTVSPVGAWVLS